MSKIKDDLKKAELETELNPTENQKKSGNYKKGKLTVKGFQITIENPAGSTRSGKDNDGKEWFIKMPFSYGYFNRTIGKDKDQIDLFIGSNIDQDFDVYVVDQIDPKTRAFDEHKVMFGFANIESAKQAYLDSYSKDWKGFDAITEMKIETFKKWFQEKSMIKYPAKKTKNKTVALSPDDRVKFISLEGEVLEEQTLSNLIEQTGNVNDFDTLVLEIASPGGSVPEGLKVMLWLESISKQEKEVITLVTANAYSIASLIMLAADYRAISQHGEVMVHNPMLSELTFANADDLEKYASELRDLESVMYELYSIFTGIEQSEIKNLMDNETYLSPELALEKGFVNNIVKNIEKRPYASVKAINTTKKTSMIKCVNALQKVVAVLNQSDVVNQLYYTKEGSDIEIFQKKQSNYSVGDKTNLKEGIVTLADGSILNVQNSEIMKIDKEVIEEPKAVEPKEETVIEEPKAMEPVVEEPKAMEPTEDPIVEETEAMEPTEPAPFEEPAPKAEGGEFMEMIEFLKSEIESLKAEIETLKGGQSEQSEFNAKQLTEISNLKGFEEVATNAIDVLARSTSSTFKPEAKAISTSKPKLTIFQNAKLNAQESKK